MAILPHISDGHLCIPWWYCMGYPLWLAGGLALFGGIAMESMDLNNIAMLTTLFIGALAYFLFGAIAKYKKQKTDAVKLKAKIAASGRDPEDIGSLTPAEKWEISKAAKFDKIFLFSDAVAIILGTAFGYAVLHYFGGQYLTLEVWEEYAVAGLGVGIISALFLDKTVLHWVADGLWESKTAEAFQLVKPVIADAIEKASVSKFDELVKTYMDGGIPAKKAKKLAEDYIANHPEALKAEE